MRVPWLAAMAAAAGCGGGPICRTSAVYDCVKPLTAEAMPCGHPFGAPGKFDSAGVVCTFADGATAELGAPTLEHSPNTPPWSFTVRKSGAVCMTFQVAVAGTRNLTTVQTSGGTYQEVDNLDPLDFTSTITCPSGVVFTDSEARACHAATRHIGYGYSADNSTVQFTLGTSAGNAQDSFEVFQCNRF
jgi:hypothetical protein